MPRNAMTFGERRGLILDVIQDILRDNQIEAVVLEGAEGREWKMFGAGANQRQFQSRLNQPLPRHHQPAECDVDAHHLLKSSGGGHKEPARPAAYLQHRLRPETALFIAETLDLSQTGFSLVRQG